VAVRRISVSVLALAPPT